MQIQVHYPYAMDDQKVDYPRELVVEYRLKLADQNTWETDPHRGWGKFSIAPSVCILRLGKTVA